MRLLPAFLTLAIACAQTPPLDRLKQEGVAEVEKRRVFTQQMVDQIFSYAELGFQEAETSRYPTTLLEQLGITYPTVK